VRYHIIRSTTAAGSGHPSSSASAVELMTALFFSEFKAELKRPDNPNNDRLIFSKGHAAPLLYALYAAAGAIPAAELLKLRKLKSPLEGHPTPEFKYTEAATGSLGQGLSVGVGLALAQKLDRTRARTFVLLGDGELAEGSNWEAAALASRYKLGNMVAIADINRLGQSDPTMHGHNLSVYQKKFAAFGWKTVVINGHDFNQILSALKRFGSPTDTAPKVIIAKTLKGKGLAGVENKSDWHGKALSAEAAKTALAALGAVDVDSTETIKTVPAKKFSPPAIKIPTYTNFTPGEKVATRKAHGSGLAALGKTNNRIVALDGDVKNSTYAQEFSKLYPKRFFEMYIAEQNMVGAALGLARRGFVPFVSTFSAFLTRAFDQIRMTAYSNGNVKFVGSHAGVSIGEDGSSQMGLEDIALFRSVHNSTVLYPSDAVATQRLMTAAAKQPGVVYIRTTRMATPVIYKKSETFPIGGSKVLCQSPKDQITLIGAGVTLHEALKAAEMLAEEKIQARVIDLYSIKPIDAQTIKTAARQTKGLIVIEDHWFDGGLGDAVLNVFANQKNSPPIIKLAITKLPHSAEPEQQLRVHGIDAAGILRAAKKIT
jgi:transketolase